MAKPSRTVLALLVAVALTLCIARPAHAYVEAAYPLGRILQESTNVLVLKVEQVDKVKNLIVYRKVQDLKGVHPGQVIKHNIGQGGFAPREWQNIMAWAEVGKTAIFFHNGAAGECCIENYWYQVSAGEWWVLTHAEPFLLRSYCGRPDKLISQVPALLAGQEVTVPCMVDGDKDALHLRTAKVQRLKASMKIQDYNPQRDFAGWGVEEFRLIAGMPAFTHYAPVAQTGPGAAGIAVADIDGDSKPDFCLFGTARAALLHNGGTSLDEIALGLDTGAYAAAFADMNGDGKPDLLLATPAGPKLLLNVGGQFRDVSAGLPPSGYTHLTAAAWIDFDGDGKPDILLADGYRGLQLYRNLGFNTANLPPVPDPTKPPAPNAPPVAFPSMFEDVSDRVGLGSGGIAAELDGDRIIVADVNGDGKPDFLFSGGAGVLLINAGGRFVEAKDAGIKFQPGGVTPVFADYRGDKHLDLLVPQKGGCKVFRNDGRAHFTDVTAKSGDLSKDMGNAVCAAFVEYHGAARPDLYIGCLRGHNHYLKNNGDGTFTDKTEAVGFFQRIFNTRAIAITDLNKDGVPDLILNNEGQESAVLMGRPEWMQTITAQASR